MEEAFSPSTEETIYVAVGRHVDKNMSALIWALENFEESSICIIHVHQQPHMIPVMGTKFPASSVDENTVTVYRERERKKTQEILDQYLHVCRHKGVKAEKLYIEMDSIEEGIVRLITSHAVKKLVMGAAAEKHYSTKMTDLTSKKAVFVRQNAPINCHIWFTCKGNLIYTREAVMHETKTISTLLSEFQRFVSREKSVDSIQDVGCSGSMNRQSGRVSDWSVDTDKEERDVRISSSRFTGTSSASGGSDEHRTEKTGKPESSSGSSLAKVKSNRSSPEELEEDERPSQEAFCCIC